MGTLGKFSTCPKKIGICEITPKLLLSNLRVVRIFNYLRYFLNKQLNFGNLTLWLWKKVTWGFSYFGQFSHVLLFQTPNAHTESLLHVFIINICVSQKLKMPILSVFIRNAENVQNMKPVQTCTCFIFCTYPAIQRTHVRIQWERDRGLGPPLKSHQNIGFQSILVQIP